MARWLEQCIVAMAIVNEITITKVIFAIGNNQHSYAAIGGILTSDRLPRVSDATIDSVTKYANIAYLLSFLFYL